MTSSLAIASRDACASALARSSDSSSIWLRSRSAPARAAASRRLSSSISEPIPGILPPYTTVEDRAASQPEIRQSTRSEVPSEELHPNAFGGEYVNNYKVSGSDSAAGLNVLNSTFPQQGGYGGQIVFHATKGTVADQQSVVNQSVSNVSKLPDVIKAVSPFASSDTGAVSKDGTIAYASVGWNVNPDSLDSSYLDKLNNAVAPVTKAGLQVEYGAGAGEIGQKTSDIKSEVIGLACALVLLLAMFGSLAAAAIPLVSAIFSVLSGLALLGLLARLITFPTTAPTIATLLGLGVAVDYGLFLVARYREQLDAGMGVVASARRAAGTSGTAIVVAGTTVSVSVLGLYISGVGFVGSLGLAAAIVVVVTMISALTPLPCCALSAFPRVAQVLCARFVRNYCRLPDRREGG